MVDFCCINSIILLFSCICCPTNTYTKEDFLYRNMIDKVKDVVDKDVKDSTQTAASENNEGSVNHVQGKNTEVTKLTERGLCIELDYKYTSIKVKSHPVFFSKLCFSSFFEG